MEKLYRVVVDGKVVYNDVPLKLARLIVSDYVCDGYANAFVVKVPTKNI